MIPETKATTIGEAIGWLLQQFHESPEEDLWVLPIDGALRSDTDWGLLTLWCRINLPDYLELELNSGPRRNRFIRPKITLFQDGHVAAARAWDDGQPSFQVHSPGLSYFADDDPLATKVKRTKRVLNPEFDEWLEQGNDPNAKEAPPRFFDVEHAQVLGRVDMFSLPMEDAPKGLRREHFRQVVPELYVKGQGEYMILEELAYHIRETFQDIQLQALFVGETWYYVPRVLTTVQEVREHSLYAAALAIIHVLEWFGHNQGSYFYHYYKAAFVDWFAHCFTVDRWDDAYLTTRAKKTKVPPMEQYYPWPERAIFAGDLPNLGNALNFVYFQGEKTIPPGVPLVKLLVKSLPFCCGMRVLVDSASTECRQSPALLRVFSAILWCSLAGMYPDAECRPTFRKMLRIHWLREHPHELLEALTLDRLIARGKAQPEDNHPNCTAIFIAFREYFIYMAEKNPDYVEVVNHWIQWDEFRQATKETADKIRDSNMFPEDAFAEMRKMLATECNKPKGSIYRYRKSNFPRTIQHDCNRLIDSTFDMGVVAQKTTEVLWQVKAGEASVKALKHYPAAALFTGREDPSSLEFHVVIDQAIAQNRKLEELATYRVATQVKSNILTYLYKATVDERYCFEVMRLPELGGISKYSVSVLYQLYRLYKEISAPKDMEMALRSINVGDFKVIAWYFNVMTRFDLVHMAPIHPRLQEEIEWTMRNKRFVLLDGEKTPESVYEVYITLCCGRIATLAGSGKYGARFLSYDPETHQLVCAKKVKKPPVEEEYDEKRARRVNRKQHTDITCDRQPILTINLEGKQLIWGNVKSKLKRYMHCPRCGSFHQYKHANWLGADYMCESCAKKTNLLTEHWKCAYPCVHHSSEKAFKRMLVYAIDGEPALNGMKHNNFTTEPSNSFQWLTFCKLHYKHAYKFTWMLHKTMVWKRMKNFQKSQDQRNLAKYNN